MDNAFYMKNLIPGGEGGFYVARFVKNTEEGAKQLRDALLAAGDWQDASQDEWDNFQSAAEAVGEIASNKAEYARIEGLADEQKELVRGAVQGMWTLSKVEGESASA